MLFTAALAPLTRSEHLAGALVVAAAMIVAESIGLSLVRLLTPAALLACQLLWLAAALALWRRRGSPAPPFARLPRPGQIFAAARSEPLLALLVAVVVIVLALQATLAIAVAPNEPDSIGYHLPRAAYWLQYHSALQYLPGAIDDPAQVAPPNAELLIAWTMAFARSDSFAQLVQWVALFGLLATIFAAARRLGFGRVPAAFAAGLFALMPEPLLQAATTQNDVLASFLLCASLLFAVTGVLERSRGRLALAALAAGLAIGTKLYAVFILPAALLLLVAALRRARPPRKLVAFGLGAFAAAALLLGAFGYIQDLVDEHRLTGYSGTPGGDFVKSGFAQTAARVGWNFVDATGLPQPDFVSDAAEHVARPLFAGLHGTSFSVPDPAIRSDSDEDQSAYGLVGLLLVALILVAALRPRAPPWQRLLALGALGYFAAYTLTIGYAPEGARYLMPAIALTAPLLAGLARRRAGAAVALALALATVPGTVLHDIYKPVLAPPGGKSIFALGRLQQQTIDADVAPMVASVRRLDTLVGAHAALGFVQQDAVYDYVLMGEPYGRRMVPYTAADVSPRAMRDDRVQGVYIGYADQAPCSGRLCVLHPAGLQFQALASGSYLVRLR